MKQNNAGNVKNKRNSKENSSKTFKTADVFAAQQKHDDRSWIQATVQAIYLAINKTAIAVLTQKITFLI